MKKTRPETIPDPAVAQGDRDGLLQGAQSVNALLHEHRAMAIPHFQRGLVWDDDNVALLLESLYHGTPCGSIILWNPPADVAARVAVTPARYVIVDGQQRIRSLQDVFLTSGRVAAIHPTETYVQGEAATESGTKGDGQTWCLNLGRIPELKQIFAGGERFSLFRKATDPREYWIENGMRTAPGVAARDLEALLPLSWFLQHSDDEIRELVKQGRDAAVSKAALAVLECAGVRRRLRQMCVANLFQVALLDSGFHLTDVIGIYNRINSAGKRVENEEKAFANLVGACDERDVSQALARFFEKVHGGRTDDRDDLLSRQRENSFGFKLFMRVFTMVLAYHSDRSLGSSGLSFESVNPRVLAKAGRHLPRILNTTVHVLEVVSRIVRTTLYCDDLRMLPDTSSLWPVFQLVIRFPETEKADTVLASMIFRLLLADLAKRELLKLCEDVNSANEASQAFAVIDGFRPLSRERTKKLIKEGVANAQSLTNRHTLMLYWLARERTAKDFDYELNPVKNRPELRRRYPFEPLLSKDVAAQKQHLVPYRQLRDLFRLDGGRRPGAHEANDIGNLTYISAALNSARIGIGSRPLNLIEEEVVNRVAHLLQDENGELLAAFTSACLKPNAKSARKTARAKYREFCRLRRSLIADAMVDWDTRLRLAVVPPDVTTSTPSARLVEPDVFDQIRECGFSAAALAAIVRLRLVGKTEPGRFRFGYLTFNWIDRSRCQILRVDLAQNGADVELKIANTALQAAFRRAFPDVPTALTKGSTRCTLADTNPITASVLDWLAAEIDSVAESEDAA